jgi:hypothetical protein
VVVENAPETFGISKATNIIVSLRSMVRHFEIVTSLTLKLIKQFFTLSQAIIDMASTLEHLDI